MKLSAPIYNLKRQAKALARSNNIPLHDALDQIANREGFSSWSLLAAKHSASAPAKSLFPQLQPGDLVLIGARPGQGKTLMSLELAVAAMKAGNKSVFFTLEYTAKNVLTDFERLAKTRSSSPTCSNSTTPTASAPITSSPD